MSTSKKNKFNTSPNTKDWFPFAKHLFITDNHPIRKSKEKCSSSIESLFSQQELEQIKGITNSLQCEMRDAVRIALFEVAKNAEAAHAKTYEKAKSGSTVKGHEGRKTTQRFNLPKPEKDQAEQVAKELAITIKEFLRLAIIWLADGIKEESITGLTKSRRLGKDEVAKQWSRENQGKPPNPRVAKLKEARDETLCLYHYIDGCLEIERDKAADERSKLTWSQRSVLDQALRDSEDRWLEVIEEYVSELDLIEQAAWNFMRKHQVDWDAAMKFAENDFAEDRSANRMTAKEQLNLLIAGKAKYKECLDQDRIKHKLEFMRAIEEERAAHPKLYEAVDLKQIAKDRELSRLVYESECQKDLEDYLNDPLMWDEDDNVTNTLR